VILSDAPPAPSWVNSGSEPSRGLDLLGLRLPVQTIGNKLLNGVTTVTPTLRYLSFRAWIAYSFAQSRSPNDPKRFREFALRVEAAIAYGNLLHNLEKLGILGSPEGKELINSGVSPLPLKELVKQLGVNIYGGPSDQLGLTMSTDTGVPALTRERGLKLAEVLDSRVSQCDLGRRFAQGETIDYADRSELEEFGLHVDSEDIPDDEIELLISFVVPEAPLPEERPRLASYSLLLQLANSLHRRPTEDDLFKAALNPEETIPSALHPILDGWLRYLIRDLLAVSHEAVLRQITDAIERVDPHGSAIESDEVIKGLLGHVGDHSEALRDVGLVQIDESPLDLSFQQFYERVQNLAAEQRRQADGLCRWQSPLDELKLIKIVRTSGIGALALLPLAWLLAAERAAPEQANGDGVLDALSHQGWARIGLKQVVIPAIRQFLKEEWTFQEVMAALAHRSVDQHLRVSWSRLSQEPKRDVAVMTGDGQRWTFRKRFNSGRTLSRLDRAVAWIEQLGLLDETGLTPKGVSVLTKAVATLEGGVNV
jgi:hypothetical protein